MTSPAEIAAQGVRDELRARTVFPELIKLPPAEFRAVVEKDPSLHSEAIARQILNHCDVRYSDTPMEHMLELLHAADFAASGGEPCIRLRIAKDLANVLRFLGRFEDAEAALRYANDYIRQTFDPTIHAAVIEFAWIALLEDTDQRNGLYERVGQAIRTFEKLGALDRAYQVRLYDAFMKCRQGDLVAALTANEDAIRRAQLSSSEEDLARAESNVAMCFRELGDFSRARDHFAEAASVYAAGGLPGSAAKCIRWAARMAIRIHGAAAAKEMEQARSAFLNLGLAGEVCRSTLAIIEELLNNDPSADVSAFYQQIEDDVVSLGVMPLVEGALRRLNEASQSGNVNEQVLKEVWDAFGPTFGVISTSAMSIVRN